VKGKEKEAGIFPNIRELFWEVNDFSINFFWKKKRKRKIIDQEIVVDILNGSKRRFFQELITDGVKSQTLPHVHTNISNNLKKIKK
jgi:hypothetical protein